MTKKHTKARRYKPMSRSDIVFRLVLALIALGVAVGGTLTLGQFELVDLLTIVLGALFLMATLAFIAVGAPFTLLAALILVPLAISRLLPNVSFVFGTWWLSAIAGWMVGAVLRSELDRRRGRGAPTSMRSRQAAGESLEWRVGRKIFREAGFSEAALVAKIQSLDGDRRTLVSATRGDACLTVAGNAQGPLMVFFSADTSEEDQWSVLTSPGSDPGQVEVMIGDMLLSHSSWETTTLEKTLAAVRYFHRKGGADPQMTWFSSPTIADWRTLAS
ncbi:hypothetical protein ACIPUB_16720 [Paeniglutamicibacter sp. ORCA_105]|uniref:hypothetical protein n=1 Tax=Paeniglutamicibacter sp. ORCA_105 TaxID=3377336 RepID=UPI0038937AF0